MGRYKSSDEQGFRSEATPQVRPGEILLGSLTGIDAQGRPLVDFSSNPRSGPLQALSTVSIEPSNIGRMVALLFAEGDAAQPVIMGLIQNSLDAVLEMTVDRAREDRDSKEGRAADGEALGNERQNSTESIKVDDERVVIEGQKEIVLKCGDASITLTRAGKILIRGKYLLNRSSGVNRIMGGSVQVN